MKVLLQKKQLKIHHNVGKQEVLTYYTIPDQLYPFIINMIP